MKKRTEVSEAVIRRLPKYYKCIEKLINEDKEKASSKELSKEMGMTSSQIRQDLNNFGCFGVQGYGYNLGLLFKEIENILGLDKGYRCIIIGAGNLGSALLNSKEFKKHKFDFLAIFDNNKEKIGKSVGTFKVKDIKNLKEYINAEKVDIAVLAVPDNAVMKNYLELLNSNITGIWNFTQTKIESKGNIKVETVHLVENIMTLAYKMNAVNKNIVEGE